MINNRMVICFLRHAIIDIQTNIIMEWNEIKKRWVVVPDRFFILYNSKPSVAVNVSFK